MGHSWLLDKSGVNIDPYPSLHLEDSPIKKYIILNKEYTGLKQKLEWIKNMKPTAALTVHHDTEEYSKITGVPFHRIMWSANENLFKDYDRKNLICRLN